MSVAGSANPGEGFLRSTCVLMKMQRTSWLFFYQCRELVRRWYVGMECVSERRMLQKFMLNHTANSL